MLEDHLASPVTRSSPRRPRCGPHRRLRRLASRPGIPTWLRYAVALRYGLEAVFGFHSIPPRGGHPYLDLPPWGERVGLEPTENGHVVRHIVTGVASSRPRP